MSAPTKAKAQAMTGGRNPGSPVDAIVRLPGGAAMGPARLAKKLRAIRAHNPGVVELDARLTHLVALAGRLDDEENATLQHLLRYGPRLERHDVAIRLDIDGRLLQNGSTRTMLFDIADLIAYISHRIPLEPGDVIATGTPAGVAAMHTPAAWLAPGSTVTVELEGLGRLSNPVRAGVPFLEP